MIVVTIERADVADLVIDSNPYAGALHIPEDGVGEVGWTYRRTYAPDSAYVPGKMLLAAVRDAASLPLSIYAHGDDTADVEAAKALLEAATTQWAYVVTVSVDGVSSTYNAEPCIPTWGPVDTGMVRARLARCQLVIPVNP